MRDKETVAYCTPNLSPGYCFLFIFLFLFYFYFLLGASEAFDRICHAKLFSKLIERNISPLLSLDFKLIFTRTNTPSFTGIL